MIDFPVPIIGFAAWSGTGKTTLLKQLIPILRSKGLRIALVKHAHHRFDIDHPGKDSHILREAGAEEVIIASRHRIASIRETPGTHEEPRLSDILSSIQTKELDLILVEGFKMDPIPKVEIHRKDMNRPYLYPEDENFIALVEEPGSEVSRPGIVKLDLGKPEEIADFVENFAKNRSKRAKVGGDRVLYRLRRASN